MKTSKKSRRASPICVIRDLFRQHQAWFSCDALGVDGSTSEQECLDWYRRLGTLFAELLDDNCLLIFLPDTSQAFPINEDTETALRSENPVKAFAGNSDLADRSGLRTMIRS